MDSQDEIQKDPPSKELVDFMNSNDHSEEEWRTFCPIFSQQRDQLANQMKKFSLGRTVRLQKRDGVGKIRMVYAEPKENVVKGIENLGFVQKHYRETHRGENERKISELLRDEEFSEGAQYIVWLFRVNPTKIVMWPQGCIDLESYLPFINASSLCLWSQHILSGLKYLNSLDIVHRDLHPKNILITPCSKAVICDFENATIMKDIDLATEDDIFGRDLFMAPEFFEKGWYTKKTDVYGFCATIAYCFAYEAMEEKESFCLSNIKDYRETKLTAVLLSVLCYDLVDDRYIKDEVLEYYKSRPSLEELSEKWPRDEKDFIAIHSNEFIEKEEERFRNFYY